MKSKLLIALSIAFLVGENIEALKFWHSSYDGYMDKVKSRIPKGSTVLAGAVYWFALHKDYKLIPSELILHKDTLQIHGIYDPYFSGSADDFFLRQGVEYVINDTEMWEGRIFQQQTIVPFIEKYTINEDIRFWDDFYNYSIYSNHRSPVPLLTEIYKVKT